MATLRHSIHVEPTDAALARRAAAGDTEAFDLLVDRHYAHCLRFATRMLGSRADAEEAVQDAFIDAYRGLHRYREQNRFRGWLLSIVVNRCRSLARAERRRLARAVRFLVGRRTHVPAQPLEDTGEVGRALLELPLDQREAFLLKHLDDLSYDEMARITGASTSALKMRVKRARDRLRILLDPEPDQR